MVWPTLSRPVCMPVSPEATHPDREERLDLIVAREQTVAVGDEDPTSAVGVAER